MDGGHGATAKAHALSVVTRKSVRQPVVEDPVQAIDRILRAVRGKTYKEAYEYLQAPAGFLQPETKKKREG